MSVIRGRVLTSDGTAVVGVRVSVVTQPLYGFTLTREQGWLVLVLPAIAVLLLFKKSSRNHADFCVVLKVAL